MPLSLRFQFLAHTSDLRVPENGRREDLRDEFSC